MLISADGAARLLLHAFFEGLLHVVVLPLDDRLRAQLLQVLLELGLALVGEDAFADLLARLLERHASASGSIDLELQELIAARRAHRLA